MADTMQFDLVSPERKLASLEATAVEIPGADGDFTAMPAHEPMLTTLRPGLLKVEAAGESTEYLVSGGFVEVNEAAASVLAERAVPRAEVTREMVDAMIADAEAQAAAAGDAGKDEGAKRVADMRALIEALAL